MAQYLNKYISKKISRMGISWHGLAVATGIPYTKLQPIIKNNLRINDKYLSKIALFLGTSLGYIKRLHTTDDEMVIPAENLFYGLKIRKMRNTQVNLSAHDEQIHQMIQAGKKYYEIAAAIGASESGIYSHVRLKSYTDKFGVEKRKIFNLKKNKILELYKQGMNPYSIARISGSTYVWVFRVIKKEQQRVEKLSISTMQEMPKPASELSCRL